MPRVPRINIENALYYVTSRGDNNQDIFKDASDYAMYLDLLRKCKDQYKFKLFAYCIVPSHLHLLIELSGATTISQIMHSLNSTYTKYFNSKHKKEGHLFQERYRMVLVEKEPNILDVTAYIHLNPKALKLAKDISEYAYSSYPSYIYYSAKAGKASLIDIQKEVKEVTALLKGMAYKDYIDKVSASDMEKLGKLLAKKAVLGSDAFVEEIKAKVEIEKQKAEERAQAKDPALVKRVIMIGATLVVVLGVAAIALSLRAAGMKADLNKEMQNKDTEIAAKLTEERQRIRQDLDEKYRADMVSFEALSKRLEAEKKKAAELEKELKGTAPLAKK